MRLIILMVITLLCSDAQAQTNQKTDSAGRKAYEAFEQKKEDSQKKDNLLSADYFQLTAQADEQFENHKYLEAGNLYAQAFKNSNDIGQVRHRYKLACCYTALNNKDSAFLQLYRIAEKGKYSNIWKIKDDKLFDKLHSDKRWNEVLEIITANAEVFMSKAQQDKILVIE